MCLGNEYTRKPGEPLFKCNDACAKVGVSLSPLGLDENLQPEESANEVVIDILGFLNDDKGVPFDAADVVYTSSSRA
jgi:hypothetical protein